MNSTKIFTINNNDEGKRIDRFLSENNDSITRSYIQKLIDNNAVCVNGKAISKNYKLRLGDIVSMTLPEPKELEVIATDIPLEIVYEDNDIILINKPKGMVVHPAAGTGNDTLVNALLFYCKDTLSGINGVLRPGIVHRIDKNTSGILIVAKNDNAHKNIAQQIKEHSFKREYEAIVYGNIKEESGVIDVPIGRHPQKRKQMVAYAPNSREAITNFKVIERYGGFTHLRLKLQTGRTHQIRVHMAYLNHPVAGDDVYGPKKVIKSLNGQCLHAKCIGFIHPTTGEYMEFETNLPDYFKNFQKKLRR